MNIIFPALFEPVSAALLLLETAVIALFWVMTAQGLSDAVVGDSFAIEKEIDIEMVVKIIQ